jgi:hypothetical protein
MPIAIRQRNIRPSTINWVIALGYNSFNPPIFSYFGDWSPRRIFTPPNGLFMRYFSPRQAVPSTGESFFLVWGKKPSRYVQPSRYVPSCDNEWGGPGEDEISTESAGTDVKL